MERERSVHGLRGQNGRDADRQHAFAGIDTARVDREIEVAAKEVIQEAGRIAYGTRNELRRVVLIDLVIEDEPAEHLPSKQEALVEGSLRHEVGDGVSIRRLRKIPARAGRVRRWIEERRPQASPARQRKV